MATRGETEVDTDAPSDPSSMGVYFAPKEFRYNRVGSELTENEHYVSVLGVGSKFLYVLPGFDVLAIEIRHIQIRSSRLGDKDNIYDLFIKNDALLSTKSPFELLLKEVTVIKVNYILNNMLCFSCVHRRTNLN